MIKNIISFFDKPIIFTEMSYFIVKIILFLASFQYSNPKFRQVLQVI